MPRRFLPTLTAGRGAALEGVATKPAPASRDADLKVVLANYYEALSSAGLYSTRRTRPWPVERAVAEAYERLVWVFKAVEAIAGNASRLPVRLKHGEDVVEDHPLYRVLNKRANPLETGRQFRKRLSAQLLLSKRGAFVELTRSRGGDIVRMDLLPPGRTRPIPGSGQTLIDHYEVWRADGSRTDIDPENVRWFREPHPLDPYCGVTPLEAAGLSVELDFFSRLYNVSFMRNDARPGGILGIDGEMDETEMDRVEDRFAAGPLEAGKLSVINGKISYVDLAARPRDAQYETTSKSAKTEILAAFGVPESVIGYAADRTFANADAELYNYWTITMPPHLDLLATGFDEDSEDDLETFIDTEDVEVLQRAKIARRAEMREEFDKGLVSPDEYREEAGYDRVDNAQTRALYIPTGRTPVPTSEEDAEEFGLGPAQDAAAAPTPGGEPEPPPEGEEPGQGPPQPRGGGGGPRPPAPAAAPDRTGQRPPAQQQGQPPARKALRLIVTKADRPGRPPANETVSDPDDRAHDKLETTLAAALAALAVRLTERALARLGSPKARKGTRHWVAEYDTDTRIGTKALDAAKAVSGGTWREEAEQTVTPIIAAAARKAADALLADLGGDTDVDVDETAAQVTALVAESAARQAEHLAILIGQADRQGKSIEDITTLVRAHEQQLTGWADRVAATAATATMAGSRDAAAAALVEHDPNVAVQRMWLTRKDDKVRDTHQKAHGKHQPLGEPFHVGAALLRYPGDPFGPAGEVINCRCRLQHRARRSGQYAATPHGEVAAAAPLAATGTEGKTVRWDEADHSRDRRGRFADIPGVGDDAPRRGAASRFAARTDDARLSQGQNPSHFVHPVTGHTMGKSEIGDTYEALFAQHGARLLEDRYQPPPPFTEVARLGGTGSRTTPLDFTIDGRGGELKSLSARAQNQKTAMRRAAVERKEQAAADAGLGPLLVAQVVDQETRTVQVYGLEAFASKQVTTMTHLGSYTYSLDDFEAAQQRTGHHAQRDARADAQSKADAGLGIDDEGLPIQPGDRVIELRDGVPHVYTAGIESKAAIGGRHVPGTPYNWRHGWEPLNAATAARYGKPFEGADHLTGEKKPPSLTEVAGDGAKLEEAVREVLAKAKLPDGVKVASARAVGSEGKWWKIRLSDDTGAEVGFFSRQVKQDDDGEWYVTHDNADVSPHWQRKGIATEVNRVFEDWYRDSGIDSIRLNASGAFNNTGGYVWARAGYDWDPATSAFIVETAVDRIRKAAAKAGNKETAKQAKDLLQQVRGSSDPAAWPTPAELAAFGYKPGAETWPGKTVMLDFSWYGRKRLVKTA